MTAATLDSPGAAWSWLQTELAGRPMPPLLVMIGLGDGAVLDALDARAPGTRVLALEPDPAHAEKFPSSPTYHSWRSGGRLVYLRDPDYAGADGAWRIFATTTGAPIVLVHPELTLAEGVARAAQVLKKILFGVEANNEARRRFAPMYLVNSVRNIPAMIAGSDVRGLANGYRGIPAVVAAAGPSLDDAMDDLRRVHDRALLIAADTALRPLLMAGISPPLVVGLDPSAANLRHFLSLPECRDTWLVSESALDRTATAVFEDRTFWFRAANHHPWPWLNTMGVDAAVLDVWGSVLTAAFQVACLAGCDPIVIVGADLSFTHGRPYARGTTYEFDWAGSAAGGRDPATIWREHIGRADPREAPDLNAQDTVTTPSLLSFRDWMVARAERSGRRVINGSRAGILFGDGVEQAPLLEALPGGLQIPPPGTRARRWSGVRPSAVAGRLRGVRDALAGHRHGADPLPDWIAFSGEGFDAAAAVSALDEAARTVETKRGRPASARVVDWSRLASGRATRHILTHLPEAVARFHAVLNRTGAAALPGGDPADRPAQLQEASRLLDEIVTAVLRGPDVSPSDGCVPHANGPVSGTYTWPETTRWAILVFEALLGIAVESPFMVAGPSARATEDRPGESSHARQACVFLAGQLARCGGEVGPVVAATFPDTSEPPTARRLTGTVRLPTDRRTARLLKRPRVLTDEGAPDAAVAYATEGGVVCVRPHRCESVLVGADGSVRTHNVWPRPILNELPLEPGGAVAWGDGLSGYPQVQPGYVLFRHGDGEVHVQELPVRPTSGTWWHGRLYWSCFPRRVDTWTGLASWSPGEMPALHLPELPPLIGLHAGGSGLVLEPGALAAAGGWRRQPTESGWTWRPDDVLCPHPLAGEGAASSRSASGAWTATAYPESDIVRLDSTTGHRIAMNCHSPLRLAWLERSLLVSTGDRELLLFENLLDVLP